MATPATPVQPDRSLLPTLSSWADVLSKSVVGVVLALYAAGFLIISLHQSKYGFTEANPFRPRILAAGAWFFFFSAIPFAVAMKYREMSWMKLARNAFYIWSFSFGLAVPTAFVVFDFVYNAPPASRTNWWLSIVQLLLALVAVILINWSKAPQFLGALASTSIAIFLVQGELRQMLIDHNFQYTSVTLWFFGVFWVALVELKVWSGIAEKGEWWSPLSVMFIVLLAFAQYYYPHLKASWGGGTPVPITLYFTKDSAVGPSQSLSAWLVDESDAGLYIVGQSETKAILVPRSAVKLVYFSDKPSESKLLKDNPSQDSIGGDHSFIR